MYDFIERCLMGRTYQLYDKTYLSGRNEDENQRFADVIWFYIFLIFIIMFIIMYKADLLAVVGKVQKALSAGIDSWSGEKISFGCDFGEKLEVLRLLSIL